jgi:ribosomal-protein-alanine N-acetyltransferase
MFNAAPAPFIAMPALETPRLLLRRIAMSDAQDLFAFGRDPEVARHVLWNAYESIAEARKYVRYLQRQYRSGEPGSWGIECKPHRKIIGTIGFMWRNCDHNSAEVGYSLSRAYWNRGIMSEALTETLRFGFETMGLNRIEAQHEFDNPASGRVMEKAGMRREGTLRNRLFNKGRYVDMVLYAVLRGEFKGL